MDEHAWMMKQMKIDESSHFLLAILVDDDTHTSNNSNTYLVTCHHY